MLDINLFRKEKGGNPELLRVSQRMRGAPVEHVDQVISIYDEWVKIRFDVDEFNKQINAIQKDIGKRMKAKEDASELVAQKNALAEKKDQLAKVLVEKEAAFKTIICNMGNIVHPSVVESMDEANNERVKFWNVDGSKGPKQGKNPNILSHHEVLSKIGGYDPVKGAAVAGHRGYFLTDVGVDLNQALINYGLSFLSKRGYKKMMTPFLMNKDVMAKTAQLSQFDEELYKVSAGSTPSDEDKYLIATSEQPLAAYHAGDWIQESELPIKFAGYSTCFRKEAGAHGKDTWGIFRVHQFEKVEQFVLTDPEKSWEMHEEMLQVSEEFYQSLGLSYQVVSIVSGALNNAAAKKLDLEAWFPFQGEYKELVSCSNCTDYQSRRLEIRCGTKKSNEREKKYVHCLNGTLSATERTLCCLLETHQTPEGVNVPEPLRPYMEGLEFIPFKK